jgi:hypothetical protein
MASAFLGRFAKECAHLPTPGHHCELVHGGDHHARRVAIDLLVDCQDGDPISFRKIASFDRITTENSGTTDSTIDFNVTFGLDFGSTPWATSQLRG